MNPLQLCTTFKPWHCFIFWYWYSLQLEPSPAQVITPPPPYALLIPPKRSDIRPGTRVRIVQKHDQPTGKLTEGVVERILTNSPVHPRGIKVRLTTGEVGRVQAVWSPQ